MGRTSNLRVQWGYTNIWIDITPITIWVIYIYSIDLQLELHFQVYIYIYWEYHKVKAKEFQDPKMGVPCPGAPGERRRARRACCKGTTCAAKIMKIWGSRGGLSGDVLKKISNWGIIWRSGDPSKIAAKIETSSRWSADLPLKINDPFAEIQV